MAKQHDSTRWLRWSSDDWAFFHFRSTVASYLAWPFRSAFGAIGREGFGVITYHRVCEPVAGYSIPTCSVTPATFRRQLLGLRRRGYQAWPLSRCVEMHRRGEAIPRNVFVIVFDDGYENVYTQAWPILRQLEMPATIFLATGYLDSDDPMPFDDWPGADKANLASDTWRCLTSSQCDEMRTSGLIELGSHTHTHQDFRNRASEFREDMTSSLELLSRRFGVETIAFALPYGFLCPGMMKVMRELSLACCLTCQGQLVRAQDDPIFWGRFGADRYDTAGTLSAKLDGWYSAIQNGWRKVRGRPFGSIVYSDGMSEMAPTQQRCQNASSR